MQLMVAILIIYNCSKIQHKIRWLTNWQWKTYHKLNDHPPFFFTTFTCFSLLLLQSLIFFSLNVSVKRIFEIICSAWAKTDCFEFTLVKVVLINWLHSCSLLRHNNTLHSRRNTTQLKLCCMVCNYQYPIGWCSTKFSGKCQLKLNISKFILMFMSNTIPLLLSNKKS